MDPQHAALLRKIGATPSRHIESARHQSHQGLKALIDLAMVWGDVPGMVELGIVDMFLSHLREEKAPPLSGPRREWQLDAEFAHLSVVGLCGMQRFFDNPRYFTEATSVLNSWPGIFRWCSYMYRVRGPQSGPKRTVAVEAIAKLFYCFSRLNLFIKAMISTAGCVELATKLWLDEDLPTGPESTIMGPIQTSTLAILLQCAPVLNQDDIYDRVLSATGQDSDFVVTLLLNRVKKATKKMNPTLGALGLSYHIDLITSLFAPAFRTNFYNAEVIRIVTNAFLELSRIIVQSPTSDAVLMMTSCFNFFDVYLEGDDYPVVVHAVKAGFILAYLDCSPTFHLLTDEVADRAREIFSDTLPQYLVYRSFVEAVNNSMRQLDTPHYKALIARPEVAEVWGPFISTLAKRLPLLEYIHKLKVEGTPLQCDYDQCRKIQAKIEFQACGNCRKVYYCSKACQKLGWKAHRPLCPTMKAEYAGHAEKGRPPSDRPFLHSLARREGDINFAIFHDIAEKQFPDLAHADLMPCIDFTCVPEAYSVKVIRPGAWGHPGVSFPPEVEVDREGKFQHHVAKARASGMTIIQTMVRSGSSIEMLITELHRKAFWEDKST
ncbi:hypothetical protein B0H16DRAFT_1885376 [Mycena metata]|uniref:MYND-type domain-containing protein n=1 Tax=Mycena metata TaxID=1033252 RepID=A0AAD7J741_9AGAR|nr:hypothetical protein B0H16DRAFT_1885376 [Mycena metata]